MNISNYHHIRKVMEKHLFLSKSLPVLNNILTAIGFVMYPALLIFIWQRGLIRSFFCCILIPGIAFVLVSVFRRLFNAPRPYELYPVQPFIHKEKKGESFPSRHIFSIIMIGGLWFRFSPMVGTTILICGAILGFIRVVGGVHFLKDVLWGAVIGIASAIITCCFL